MARPIRRANSLKRLRSPLNAAPEPVSPLLPAFPGSGNAKRIRTLSFAPLYESFRANDMPSAAHDKDQRHKMLH